MADSKVTISSRNLDNDEIDFKVKFAGGASESRKSKLKKIAIPILTFVLLKAITLVPLGLGILGIKAFNALQLSFFSFVISVGLATFQLCRKVSADQRWLVFVSNFELFFVFRYSSPLTISIHKSRQPVHGTHEALQQHSMTILHKISHTMPTNRKINPHSINRPHHAHHTTRNEIELKFIY